jgi:hypothetical protein
MIAWAPVISYNPASGVGIGAAGNVAFYRGHPDHTRISSLVGSLIGTTKEQDGSTGVYLAVQEAF